MLTSDEVVQSRAAPPNWLGIVSKYHTPDVRIGLWQIAITLVPYILLWVLMYWSLNFSYWLTLFLSLPTALFMVRVFVIMHDCGHGAFFKSVKLNNNFGMIFGVLTWTPYYSWRHGHAIHHKNSGDLDDRRDIGVVKLFTVKEYQALAWWQKLSYRIYRNPAFMFLFGAPFNFLILNRFPYPTDFKRDRISVHLTTLALVGYVVGMITLVGWQTYLLLQLPVFFLATVMGVWLFYVQHQFVDTYWRLHPEWDFMTASLQGSSFYNLPRWLHWFTANIGFHHIHHLSSRIPYYRLQEAYRENELFRRSPSLTLLESLRTLDLGLWDEDLGQMVSFSTAVVKR